MLEIEQIKEVINVSIIDVIGESNGGVSLMLNLMVFEEPYEIAYWFNDNGDIRLVPEQKLLDNLELESIYDYEYIEDLVYFIHTSIPNMDKIIEEFFKK